VSVSLADDDKALLGMVARVENRSRSAVMRRAVRSYADEKGIDMENIEYNHGSNGPSDQGALAAALEVADNGHANPQPRDGAGLPANSSTPTASGTGSAGVRYPEETG
jgi:hypothetical protein